jgi:ketosteroid isomerase-like protein
MLGALIAQRKVRKGFASIAKGDMDTFISVFSDDAVVIYPTKGTFTGKEAILGFFLHFVQTFPKIEPVVHNIGVENIFDLVGTNVIFTHFVVSTTNRNGVTFKHEGMQLFKAKRGKLTSLHYFFFDTEALRHAWKESE